MPTPTNRLRRTPLSRRPGRPPRQWFRNSRRTVRTGTCYPRSPDSPTASPWSRRGTSGRSSYTGEALLAGDERADQRFVLVECLDLVGRADHGQLRGVFLAHEAAEQPGAVGLRARVRLDLDPVKILW